MFFPTLNMNLLCVFLDDVGFPKNMFRLYPMTILEWLLGFYSITNFFISFSWKWEYSWVVNGECYFLCSCCAGSWKNCLTSGSALLSWLFTVAPGYRLHSRWLWDCGSTPAVMCLHWSWGGYFTLISGYHITWRKPLISSSVTKFVFCWIIPASRALPLL